MTLRQLLSATLGSASLAVLGCGTDPATDTPPVADTNTIPGQGLVEKFRADTPVNANSRLFIGNHSFGFLAPLDSIPSMHVRYVDGFIQEPGFGGGRMVRLDYTPSPQWTELHPEDGDLPPVQPDKSPKPGSPPSRRVPDKDIAKNPHPTYDRGNEVVTYTDGSRKRVSESAWNLKQRYLIGLTHETGPRVILHDAINLHTVMKFKADPKSESAAKSMPSRVPDAFETEALARLREGDEVIVNTQPHEMRMVGAIRARNECLSCHKVAVGDLLGAFTYTLAPQSEATPDADCLKDTAGLTAVELTAVEALEAIGGKVVRQAGQPITEVHLAYARAAEIAEKSKNLKNMHPAQASYTEHFSTRLPAKNSALKHLAAFPELQVLDVSHSLVNDAAIPEIVKRKQLKTIDVTNSAITADGVIQLKMALPNCKVIGNPQSAHGVAP